jgi:hypothetical protein
LAFFESLFWQKNKNLLDSKLAPTSVEQASHFGEDLQQVFVFA